MSTLESLRAEFRRYKTLADRAVVQVADADLHTPLGPDENSLAIILAHMGGNLRSRFTDFLTSDGEKEWRNRDEEFIEKEIDRKELLEIWERGWACLFDAIDPLNDADLARIVTIRGEPHTVAKALTRALGHAAYHSGQIVQLARHFAGPNWRTLSIPRGKSEQYNRHMRDKRSQ